MTELILNGTSIVLPQGFSYQFVEENSILTKNGEYSFDIEISLLNAINGKFFNHINRFNASKDKSLTSAVLIVDNNVRLNGTGKIISINNDTVKIQILSGNSELNYICDDKLMLSSINFGSVADPITLEVAVASIMTTWPNMNFVCARNTIANEPYNFIVRKSDVEVPTIRIWEEELFCKYNIQPYLMYYFNKIIDSLGYSIIENILAADDFFNRLIIFSGKVSLNYNDLLPDWTVIKFLEQIEKLANVVYIINKHDKTIRIVRSHTHYNTAISHNVYHGDIMDMYDCEADVNDYGTLNYEKVKYNLDSIEYYKYQSLSDDAMKTATIENYANFASLLSAYSTNTLRHEAYQTLKIFKVLNTGNYYIMRDMDTGINFYFKRINLLKEINEGKEADAYVEFDIIPVEIRNYVGSVNEVAENETVITDLNTVILNDLSTTDKNDLIYVGHNLGIEEIGPDYNTGYLDYYQISTTDCYKLLGNEENEALISNVNKRFSLGFNGIYGTKARYYNDNLTIDNLHKWSVYFKWKNEYDVRNYFVFLGRKYYCEKIEVEGDLIQTGGYVTGTFYSVY